MEKIVLFDAYGTLFKLETENKLLDSLLGEKKALFFNLWRQKLLEYSWLTTLMGEWEPFNTIVKKAIKFASEECVVPRIQIEPILMQIYENPSVYSDTSPGLQMLVAAGCTCSVMSNGEPETLKNAVAVNSIDQLIDRIFSATQVKHYKVSPLVYRMATEHYNIGPSNIYFISSNAWDISGAQQFGYQTIWINRESKVFDALVEGPDHEVSSIVEAAQIITSYIPKS